ncbi:hypothetical protein B0T21DRAFT_359906 [Apiosordaria backusii]|uniref:Uncharacterized protein n=1 Tax=Apiosordaria backusii TaxID=314023 RepID=A0AA40K0Q3_9PEZI|nr:hypothetical protein B0T21DRAFT_359906 [Apiosordaria backusii]
MGAQGKFFTIAAVVALGIANGYYTFNPSLKEAKEKADGTYLSKTLENQDIQKKPASEEDKKSSGQ